MLPEAAANGTREQKEARALLKSEILYIHRHKE